MSVNFTAADRIGGIGGYIGGIATLLNGGLGNVMGGACGCGPSAPVTKDYLSLTQELAAKDSHIALLEADKYTDQKLSEVYVTLNGQINDLAKEVRCNKEAQYAVNMNQAVLNGTTGATISCIQAQVAALNGLARLVIPNSSVCPGWGSVDVTPAAAPTTGA